MDSMKKIRMFLMEHEGKKIQVNIAQMNEILKLISLLLFTKPEAIATLIIHGQELYKEYLKEIEND